MKRIGIILALLGQLFLFTSGAAAWHGPGHMTVAKIAYDELKSANPQVLATIGDLLKKHPHYCEFLSKNRPDNVNLDEWVFVQAATWPDWVRPPKHPTPHQQEIADKYNHPPWHFVNSPFVIPPDQAKEQEFQPKASSDPDAPTNILEAIAFHKAVLTKAGATDEDKAVSICWLLHLLGDIHQPLHCAMLVSKEFRPPEWDEGGNLLLVIPFGGTQVTNLHSYWDSLVLRDNPDYAAVDSAAQNIRHSPKYTRQALPDLNKTKTTDWAQESLDLAKKYAYQDGNIKIVTGREDHPPLDVPALDEAYGKCANDVAEKRMALAGYRLADELRTIVKAP
jgi:hypothetical protein